MLSRLWKCCSAVHSILKYLLYGSFGFISRLLTPFIRYSLSTHEEPHDLESCGHPPSDENQAVSSSGNANPVLYEPLSEILSVGSTSLIARIKPGVVVKCPRYSWWHSTEAANANSFVREIKHSFEVEERLLNILGTHPRIIRYVNQTQVFLSVNF